MSLFWTAFLLFLPAGVANMTPVIVNKIPFLNRWRTPLDMGRRYRGKRVLGDNKTWRGLVCGVAAAGLTGWILFVTTSVFDGHSLVFATIASAACGLGVILGDATESFFKRQRGIPSGQKWFPFDQIDYIIGGLLFYTPFIQPSFDLVLAIFAIYFVGHLAVTYIGYLLGFKSAPI